MKYHTFESGLSVYESHLLEIQKLRYRKRNVHEEDEENIFIDIINSLPKQGCYVSVGSAIGYYPLLTKKIRPDINIYCFEPLTMHVNFFRDNIKLNGFSDNDFNIYNIAISKGKSLAPFKDNSYGSHIIQNESVEYSMSVQTIGLCDIFEFISVQDVDFLQMDIQGHEQAVLSSYFADMQAHSGIIRSFLVGTHGDEIHTNCRRLFFENGYALIVDNPDAQNQPDGILYSRLKG